MMLVGQLDKNSCEFFKMDSKTLLLLIKGDTMWT